MFMNHSEYWAENDLLGTELKAGYGRPQSSYQAEITGFDPRGIVGEEKGASEDIFLSVIWIRHMHLFIYNVAWSKWWTLMKGIF